MTIDVGTTPPQADTPSPGAQAPLPELLLSETRCHSGIQWWFVADPAVANAYSQALAAHAYKAALATERAAYEAMRAAKERAEAERDELRSAALRELASRIEAEAEVARLTSALTGARRALHDVLDDVDRALSHPTTEPAKAEENR